VGNVALTSLKCGYCAFTTDVAVQLFAACEKCGRAFSRDEESNRVCDDCYVLNPASVPRGALIIARANSRWLRLCPSCLEFVRGQAASTPPVKPQVRHVPPPSKPESPSGSNVKALAGILLALVGLGVYFWLVAKEGDKMPCVQVPYVIINKRTGEKTEQYQLECSSVPSSQKCRLEQWLGK